MLYKPRVPHNKSWKICSALLHGMLKGKGGLWKRFFEPFPSLRSVYGKFSGSRKNQEKVFRKILRFFTRNPGKRHLCSKASECVQKMETNYNLSRRGNFCSPKPEGGKPGLLIYNFFEKYLSRILYSQGLMICVDTDLQPCGKSFCQQCCYHDNCFNSQELFLTQFVILSNKSY